MSNSKASLNQTKTATVPLPLKKAASQVTFVAKAIAAIEAIRADAVKHHTQYELPGRKSMLDMMSRVYAQYHASKNSTEHEKFMNNVRSKLTTMNINFRVNSPEATQLIRFVFIDLSDKQAHVYGRSLEVAYAKGKAPADFVDFVEKTKGRFDGIRHSASAAATETSISDNGLEKSVAALSEAENEATLDTLEVSDWQEGETYRVLIAVRNPDDTAAIKDAKLSPDVREKALLLYLSNKQALTKAANAPMTQADKDAILQAELAVQNATTKLNAARLEQSHAATVGDTAKSNTLVSKVKWLELQAKCLSEAVKELKNCDKATLVD